MEDSAIRVGRRGHDLKGQRFGALVVQLIATPDAYKRRRWNCVCDCGVQVVVIGTSLRGGTAKSCGCLNRKLAAENVLKFAVPASTKHGLYGTPLHQCWSGMINRCENPKHAKFKYWGGKGITVCPEWRADFLVFRAWALVTGWKQGLQLDRIDGSKRYEPGNCQWLTASEHSTKTQLERWSKK